MQGEDSAEPQWPRYCASVTNAAEVNLIERIARGNRHAFELLYRQYFARLGRFLNKMTRSTHLIEEVINDTMLIVWQKAQTYDQSCKVSTWIFAIAYRKALKAIKNLDEPLESDFELFEADLGWEPEHEVIAQQTQKAIAKALDELPLEQRAVVTLTYYHGMGYDEIAGIMNCSVNTIKTRMFHARRKLKISLSPEIESA